MQVDFTLSGGAPRWAEGPGIPGVALDNAFWAWRPSAVGFGQFVHAVGERYSGSYVPRGSDRGAPAGQLLGAVERAQLRRGPRPAGGRRVNRVGRAEDVPQPAPRRVERAARHRPRSVDRHDPDRGGRRAGPHRPRDAEPSGGASRRLRTDQAAHIPAHAVLRRRLEPRAPRRAAPAPSAARRPRPVRVSSALRTPRCSPPAPSPTTPIRTTICRPQWTRRTIRTTRRSRSSGTSSTSSTALQRAYGSHERFPIYDTEYGYITHPPNAKAYVSPATAAYYINWAEYLSWKQPRVASTMQYLLYDPPRQATNAGDGGFTSGLLFSNGRRKPAFAAYRLPLYLPVTSTRRGRRARGLGLRAPGALRDLRDGPATGRAAPVRARLGWRLCPGSDRDGRAIRATATSTSGCPSPRAAPSGWLTRIPRPRPGSAGRPCTAARWPSPFTRRTWPRFRPGTWPRSVPASASSSASARRRRAASRLPRS